MRLSGAVQNIKTKITLGKYEKLRITWEVINAGIINLNSFLMLYYRRENRDSMKYVICAGAIGYVLILVVQFLVYRKHPKKRIVFQKTKNIFRLIYTAIYLTVIMLDVLVIADRFGTEAMLAYYGWLFIWITLWGTKCLWLKKVFQALVIGKKDLYS